MIALISNVCITTPGVYRTQSRYRYRIQMTWNPCKAVDSQDAHLLGGEGSRKKTWSKAQAGEVPQCTKDLSHSLAEDQILILRIPRNWTWQHVPVTPELIQ